MGFARQERRTTLDELDGAIDLGPLDARMTAISPRWDRATRPVSQGAYLEKRGFYESLNLTLSIP